MVRISSQTQQQTPTSSVTDNATVKGGDGQHRRALSEGAINNRMIMLFHEYTSHLAVTYGMSEDQYRKFQRTALKEYGLKDRSFLTWCKARGQSKYPTT